MPTKRRIKAAKRRGRPKLMPWEDRPVSIEDWHRHRDELMRDAGDGKRPEEWWLYEHGMPCPENESAALYAMGELAEDELARLMTDWRAWYAQAWQPGFAYCIGALPGNVYATWLEGVAARKAHYRWAGIPVPLIRQWHRERRRAAKIVRELARQA